MLGEIRVSSLEENKNNEGMLKKIKAENVLLCLAVFFVHHLGWRLLFLAGDFHIPDKRGQMVRKNASLL